jgi:peptidyl-dipeptidase Dcp
MKRLAYLLLAASACAKSVPPAAAPTVAATPPPAPAAEPAPAAPVNPFFAESTLPLHYPPFDKIKDSDFGPAFDKGMADQLAEVQTIAGQSEAPTFDNTILALERSGRVLARAQAVFSNLVGADANDEREKIRADYAPKLAAHRDAILMDPKLFARVKDLQDKRASLGLDAEGVRLVERYYLSFVRAGAQLSEKDKARLKEINGELASLSAQFAQNVRAEVNDSSVVVDSKEELAGLTDEQIAAAAEAAKEAKLEGQIRHRAAEHHRPAARDRPREPGAARAPPQGVGGARPPRQRLRHDGHRLEGGDGCAPRRRGCSDTRTMPPTSSRTRPPSRPRR